MMAALLASNAAHAWDYVYGDGSANVYRMTPRELHYVLVKKENSSSGVYSGGVARTVTLSDADYRSLGGLLDAAIADKAAHTDKRVMMSGAITRNTGDTKAHVILKPDAPVKREIEAALAVALQRGKPP